MQKNNNSNLSDPTEQCVAILKAALLRQINSAVAQRLSAGNGAANIWQEAASLLSSVIPVALSKLAIEGQVDWSVG